MSIQIVGTRYQGFLAGLQGPAAPAPAARLAAARPKAAAPDQFRLSAEARALRDRLVMGSGAGDAASAIADAPLPADLQNLRLLAWQARSLQATRPAAAPVPAAPAPVPTVAAPAATPAAAPALNLPGLKPGMRYALADGTQVKGFSIGGTAAIEAFDGQSLTLRLDASAMMGMVHKTIAVKCRLNPDGKTMHIDANELGAGGQPGQSYMADDLAVVANQPGRITLRDPQGREGSLAIGADGTITIQHPSAGPIVLRPAA